MKTIINIAESIFFLYSALWGFLYYTGRLNYTGDKEKRRQERVKRYGGILIVGIVLAFTCGLSMLILTLS